MAENFYQQNLSQRIQQADLTAWLVLNDRCNWKCTHCYFPSHSQARKPEEALTVAQSLVDQGITVVPAAGEVLLEEKYLAVYSAVNAKHILSNGLRLASKDGQRIVRKIKEAGIEQVGFTLHEGGEFNILHGVSPETVAKAVETVKTAGLTPTATAVITSVNIDRLPQICQLALDIGIDAIRFNRLIPTEPKLRLLTPTPGQTKQFFDLLEKVRAVFPKEVLKIYASGLFGKEGRHKNYSPDYHYCLAGRKIVAIGLDNQVYPCLMLMDPKYSIGQIDPKNGNITINNNPFQQNQYGKSECAAYQLLYLGNSQ